tara:strand:- start:77 stop:343 length:267 start_codon:yes stop_codon:yes gene_type:complete
MSDYTPFKMKGFSGFGNEKPSPAKKLRDLPDMPDWFYKYHPGFAAGRLIKKGIKASIAGRKKSGGKVHKDQKSFMADAKKNTKSIFKK